MTVNTLTGDNSNCMLLCIIYTKIALVGFNKKYKYNSFLSESSNINDAKSSPNNQISLSKNMKLKLI
jgi:hypothetical protein